MYPVTVATANSPLGSLKFHLIHYVCKLNLTQCTGLHQLTSSHHIKISAFSPIIKPPPSLPLHTLSSPPFFSHTSFVSLHLPNRLLKMCVCTILLIKKDIHPHTQDMYKVMWALTITVTHPGLKTCSLDHTYKNTPPHTHNVLKSLAGLDVTACRVQASALSFNMTSFTPAVTC